MLPAKQFVQKIVNDNQALFKASQLNVKDYFDSKPSQQELVDHFIGRMVNERMNMVEISQTIANLPADTDPVELQLLTQQAHDEAVHFRLVKEVIEHISGEKLDVEKAIADEAVANTAKGASLLAKYDANKDGKLDKEELARLKNEAAIVRGTMGIASAAAKLTPRIAFNISDESLMKFINDNLYRDVLCRVLSLDAKIRMVFFCQILLYIF